jgi:integrase
MPVGLCCMSAGLRTALPLRIRYKVMNSAHCVQREGVDSLFAFVSERGSPFTPAGFGRLIERAGASLDIKLHAHMFRRACGFALANAGHDTRAIQGWLGHRT